MNPEANAKQRESTRQPELGPLEMYRSVWPDRYVRWHEAFSLWEIRQVDEAGDCRIEFVFSYEGTIDPRTGETATPARLEAMREAKDKALVRHFRPFDYPFVRERLRQRESFLALGVDRFAEQHREQQQAVAARHERTARSNRRDRILDALPAYNPGRGANFKQEGALWLPS